MWTQMGSIPVGILPNLLPTVCRGPARVGGLCWESGFGVGSLVKGDAADRPQGKPKTHAEQTLKPQNPRQRTKFCNQSTILYSTSWCSEVRNFITLFREFLISNSPPVGNTGFQTVSESLITCT